MVQQKMISSVGLLQGAFSPISGAVRQIVVCYIGHISYIWNIRSRQSVFASGDQLHHGASVQADRGQGGLDGSGLSRGGGAPEKDSQHLAALTSRCLFGCLFSHKFAFNEGSLRGCLRVSFYHDASLCLFLVTYLHFLLAMPSVSK
jgi:hypothetical protein